MVTKTEVLDRIGDVVGRGVVVAVLVHDGLQLESMNVMTFKRDNEVDIATLVAGIDSSMYKRNPRTLSQDVITQIRYVVQEAIDDQLSSLIFGVMQEISKGNTTLDEFIDVLKEAKEAV